MTIQREEIDKRARRVLAIFKRRNVKTGESLDWVTLRSEFDGTIEEFALEMNWCQAMSYIWELREDKHHQYLLTRSGHAVAGKTG